MKTESLHCFLTIPHHPEGMEVEEMKRGLYVYAVLLCIFLLLTSSCIKNKESKTYDEEGLLYYTENGEGYHYYANARSNAVEAWFHGIIPETAVKSEGLRFVDYVMEKTRIVIGRTEPFTKDSLLFSITGYNGNKKPYKTYMPDYPASLSGKRDNTNYPNDPPYLLGDFNDDLIVNLIDFSIFVSHYQSSAGQGGYNVVCDISPAVNAVGGIWSEIIDTPYPDGNVNLMDFSNFVKNYQKTHPGEGADSPDNPPGNRP